MTISKKLTKFKCYVCSGTGKVEKKKCTACEGTGKFKESTYYIIDDKQKIAFSADTLK